MRRGLIATLALGVILAACGSSSATASHTTTSTSTPASTSTSTGSGTSATTTAPAGADTALAAGELLPASAYPAGWKGQGSSTKTTGASFFAGISSSQLTQITSCLGIPTTNIDSTPAEAADQEYDDPNSNVTVTDTVDVFPTTADALTDVAASSNPKTPNCFVQLEGSALSQGIAQRLGQGTKVGQVAVTDRQIPSYGDHDSDVVISIPFTDNGVSGTEYLEFVVVQKGRSESNFQFSNTGSPTPSTVVDQLAQAAANKMT